MKTLLVTLEYPPFYGGIANYYANLAKNWPEADNFFVLTNNNQQLVKSSWIAGKWLPAIWAVKKEVEKKKIDHILVGQILPLGTAVYFLTRRKKIPYSVILHGMDFTFALAKPRKRFLAKRILLSAQNIICANSYTAHLVKDFLPGFARRRVKIVNPGLSPKVNIDYNLANSLRAQYSLDNKLVLFSLGRLVKRKGFDLVIRAIPQVLEAVPQAIYFLAGDGPDKDWLKEQAKNLDFEAQKRIIFLGSIKEEEKWAWLSLADIFVMPARSLGADDKESESGILAKAFDFEGFGIVYLEANLLSLPVIAGDSGGVRDAVLDGVNGILVSPPTQEGVVKAIIRLGLDKNLRRQLGNAGRERVLREFRWPDKARQVYEIIGGKK